jgi:hypothetical protein
MLSLKFLFTKVSVVFTDNELEFSSSGSVYSTVESFNTFSVEPPAFSQAILPSFFVQFIHVECVPALFYSPKPIFPSDYTIPNQTDSSVPPRQRRLIKWSLPPPVNMQAVTPLPGWKPMP